MFTKYVGERLQSGIKKVFIDGEARVGTNGEKSEWLNII